MKIYVAGKITGENRWEMKAKFTRTAEQLKREGNSPFVPCVLPDYPEVPHSDYMHICYAMIDVCDAVYMQKDWRVSKGARMELQYARSCKKKIFYEDESTREDSEQKDESTAEAGAGKSEKEKCCFIFDAAEVIQGNFKFRSRFAFNLPDVYWTNCLEAVAVRQE